MRKHDPTRKERREYFSQFINETRSPVKLWAEPQQIELDEGLDEFAIHLMRHNTRVAMIHFIRKTQRKIMLMARPPKGSDEYRYNWDTPTVDALVNTSERFMSAAESGRVEEVLSLVNEGFPINYQDPVTGKTALHVAASSCARPLILALIKTDMCDFLLRDKKGRLASEMAFVYGDDVALARLLRSKEVKQAKAEGVKITRRP